MISFSICLCSCNNSIENVKINYGDSKIYSHNDIYSAIKVVEDEFSTWSGCELHLLEYMGDDYCTEQIDYCNELGDGKKFTQCIVFDSSFHSPKLGGGAWNADEEYSNWEWFLAREDNGEWNLLTWGYA